MQYTAWRPPDPGGVVGYIAQSIGRMGCGRIEIPPGRYEFNSPIYKPRCISLEGGSGGAVILVYSGSGAALVVGDMEGRDSYAGGGLRDLTLVGPGAGSGAIGIFVGGDPGGVMDQPADYGDLQTFDNVRVQGFGTGYEFGDNCWLESWNGGAIFSNGVGIRWREGLVNSGENLSMVRTAIFNNSGPGLDLSGGEWYGFGVSLDFNGAGDGPAISGAGFRFSCFGCHMEQDIGALISSGGGSESDIALYGGWLALDSSYSTDAAMLRVGGVNSALLVVSTVFTSGHRVDDAICFTATGDRRTLTVLNVDASATAPYANLVNELPPWPGELIAPSSGAGVARLAGALRWVGTVRATRGELDSLGPVAGVGGSHCFAEQTSGAAGSLGRYYVTVSGSQIVLHHELGAAGEDFDVFCSEGGP